MKRVYYLYRVSAKKRVDRSEKNENALTGRDAQFIAEKIS